MGYPASITTALASDQDASLYGTLALAPAADTASGVHTLLTVTGAADTARTASTEQTDVNLNLARTVTWATGALTTQRFVRVQAPTLAFVGASTVTTAVTVDIGGAPVAGTNATLTNTYALRVATGTAYFGGAVALTPAAGSSGVRTALTLTGATDTGLTASTEQNDVYLNCARTLTWATGALTNQRAIRIAAPTLAFAGASTVTNASTVYIDDAPTAGTNATLTNAYALFVDAGRVRFDGAVVQNTYPVLQVTGTDASPVTTINTPMGITVVANGASSVTVTCAACTATSHIHAVIRNATSNNVSIRAVIPGSGSFVVHLSGDPGVSTAIVGVQITQPGSGV